MPDASTPEMTIEIVRATMRIAVEPWRLADNLEDHNSREEGRRKCGGAKGGCRACALSDALYHTQRQVAGALNLIARHHERRDGLYYQEQRLQGVDKVKFPKLELDGYQLARSAFPELLSGITAAASYMAENKWKQERWDILVRNERSPARYTAKNAPIPLRAADVTFRADPENRDLFWLGFSTASGRTQRSKQWQLPLRSKDQKQFNLLQAIADGKYKMGALQLQRDIHHKWHLRMSYKRQVELKVQSTKWAAINRGIIVFIAVTTEDEEEVLYDGHDIEAYMNQMFARRKEYQRTYKVSGRKGRGRMRALRPIEVLRGRTDRWRKTRIQTIARELATWLHKRGVTHVVIEDFKGIRDGAVELLEGGKPVWDRIQTWPYYEMGQRLKACCEELGIVCIEMTAAYSARTCPKCGKVKAQKEVTRTFVCDAEGCKYRHQIDAVTATNQWMKARERHGDGTNLRAELLANQEEKKSKKRGSRKDASKSSE